MVDFWAAHWWTGAILNENSWVWERSGNEIDESKWAAGQPDLDGDFPNTCMHFKVGDVFFPGWYDDSCDADLNSILCQHKTTK